MRMSVLLALLIILMAFSGCSNTRFLADDQMLYTGRKEVKVYSTEKDEHAKDAKALVQSVSGHKVNNAIFEQRVLPPIGLWVHNYWSVDEQKRVMYWMQKSMTAPPILISDINPELRAQKIQNELFDQGYFKASAWASVDTSARNPKKAKVSYYVDLSPPYRYNQIEFDTVSESIDTLIDQDHFGKMIKEGDQFNLDKLKTARSDLAVQIQNEGYFYFNHDYLELNVDTALEMHKLNLVIGKQKNIPKPVLSTFEIGHILVHISRASDSLSMPADTTYYQDLKIISSDYYLKPDVLDKAIFFNVGELYSYELHRSTLTRLNNLGIFSSARISFQPSGQDSLSQLLNVNIDLQMLDNIGLDLTADMVMKSTGFLGPALSAGISHNNAFKGAEKIQAVVNAGVEWQWGSKEESELGTLAYDFGVSTGLTYPRFILPGKNFRFKSIMNQSTSINLDLNILNRTEYYKMFSAMTELNYKWKRNSNIQHSFSPLYLNSVSLLETTEAFDSIVNENIYIQKSFEEQFILGTKYEFTYDNSHKIRPHGFFFLAGIRTSGNLVDLFAGTGKDESDRPYTLMNNVYSQYVKLTTDVRYYLNGFNKSLVFRFYTGLGLPYLNSVVIPYVEQFFSGGAYSVRGFTARTLGPGSYYEEGDIYIDQSGDLKLEFNMEYRFGISKILQGALFLETGNIWLVSEDVNRPGSQFHFNTFYDELAVGTGFGLRFDFNFFVLRTDVGFPLRTPYEMDDSNWVMGDWKVWKEGLFYIAIGYPF